MLTADTIVPDPSVPQTLNRYAYVENNPVNHRDSNGHCQDRRHCEAWFERWNPGKRIISQEYTPLHRPDNLVYPAWPEGSPFTFSMSMGQSKPEFPIAPPEAVAWTAEQGNNASRITDIAGVALSGVKGLTSLAGVGSYLFGAEKGVITDKRADLLDDALDGISLFLDIVGETATGRNRIAVGPDDLTLIIGQDTLLSIASITFDKQTDPATLVAGGSAVDLGLNTAEVGYGVAKLNGRMPNMLELQITVPGHYGLGAIELIIYDDFGWMVSE